MWEGEREEGRERGKARDSSVHMEAQWHSHEPGNCSLGLSLIHDSGGHERSHCSPTGTESGLVPLPWAGTLDVRQAWALWCRRQGRLTFVLMPFLLPFAPGHDLRICVQGASRVKQSLRDFTEAGTSVLLDVKSQRKCKSLERVQLGRK